MSKNNGQSHQAASAAAVVYCRVSTAKQQQRNELNLPAQQKRCEDWCTAQGIPVLHVFVAEGESAWKTERPTPYARYWCWNKECKHPVSVSRDKLEADWLRFLEGMQPAFDALVNVLPVLAKANAHKRIEDAEQRQRHLATQLSEKKALRNSLIEKTVHSASEGRASRTAPKVP